MKRKGAISVWKIFFHWGIIVVLMALLIAGDTVYYYKSFQGQLFSERHDHLTEMTIKISEVIDITVESMQDKADYASAYIENVGIESSSDVLEALGRLSEIMGMESETLLAMDGQGIYYSSNGKTGRWSNMEDYALNDAVPVIRDLNTNNDDSKVTCMVFFEKLEKSKEVSDKSEITHVAVAVPLKAMQEYLSISMFGDNCYTYLINNEGRVLYRQTFSDEFLENYNAIVALAEEKFINGGNIDDLTKAVSDREQFCAEFRESTNGEHYFVSTAPVEDTPWTILLFVPTKVLGAQTSNFVESFIRYIVIISVAVIIIVGCLISVVLTNKNNRERMIQQENNNKLLSVAAKEAQSANAAKSEFLSHMSHDIRTPINGIIGMTNIAIKNTDDTERVKDCLNKISGAADHLLALVNDVLDMSRIESGKTTVINEPVDMNVFINECASIIDGQLISRQIDFIKEFDKFQYPFVYADQLHLRQVLINILGNAVKFTQDGGRIIFRVKETGMESWKIRYCFEVEDNGIGMSEEFQGKIFDEFSQEREDGRTNYKGTGLGMAISKQLVELMGGTISLKSKFGEGSCFTVNMEFEINSEPEEKEKTVDRTILSGLKVLLVEDNELNMEIAQEILGDEGIESTPAVNGKEALDKFTASPVGTFDVILMDVMMPIMNGIDATRAIRSSSHPQAKTIPIIAMTANAYKEDEEKVIEAGMNAHVAKPVDVDILMSVLAKYVKGREVSL
jgi:signal transduction histidine kinase/ActR/RegA family two-component response regulator